MIHDETSLQTIATTTHTHNTQQQQIFGICTSTTGTTTNNDYKNS
jgi:hypothetical protein